MKYIPTAWRIGRLSRILRGQDGAVRQPLLYGIPLLLASALVLFSATDSDRASELPAVSLPNPDKDGDRMMDAYETYALFFGLNPTNLVADAYMDFDGDHLNNLQEFAQLTDPFAPDTDRDGFEDNVDADPISRAYIQWGAPQLTTGDQYDYAHPDWFLRAYKTDGEWLATPCEWSTNTNTRQAYDSAWYVPASESNGVGSLSIDLDRTILTNNLRYAVHYLDAGNASLYVDLLDTNGEVVAKDLYGNLMGGTNAESAAVLGVPTGAFTNAAVIHLRRGKGEVTVYEGLVYIDEDGDGLDSDQEKQLGTSDYCVDSNHDGVSDYQTWLNSKNHGGPTNSPTDPPTGPDKKDGPDKKTGIIYVDQAIGDDSLTGRANAVSGKHGPKKTIRKGLLAVDEDGAHTLIIKSGAYNENLDLRGKNIRAVMDGNVRL